MRFSVYRIVLLGGVSVFVILQLIIMRMDYEKETAPDVVATGRDPLYKDRRFDCVNYTRTRSVHGAVLSFPVCVYMSPQDELRHTGVSQVIRAGRGWHVHKVKTILTQLGEPGGDVGFVDLGADIGVFSLAAAAAGHPVLVVDAMATNVARMQVASRLGGFADRLQLIHAGLGERSGEIYMKVKRHGHGSPRLVRKSECVSDLEYTCQDEEPIPVLNIHDIIRNAGFRKVFIKIDTGNDDYKYIRAAAKMFKTFHISHIHMQFKEIKQHKRERNVEIEEFLGFMVKMGYAPISLAGEFLLSKSWRQWTDDVIWVKEHGLK